MKVYLVYPNFKSANAGGTQEPLGILSVASVLRQAGHNVVFTDMTFSKEISVIDEHVKNADLLGIGCSTPLFGRAVEILARAKRINPRLFSITGGPHATQDPGDALRQGFDAVVMGESERSVADLVNCLDKRGNWTDLPGLAYMQGEKMYLVRAAPQMRSIICLASPDAARSKSTFPESLNAFRISSLTIALYLTRSAFRPGFTSLAIFRASTPMSSPSLS